MAGPPRFHNMIGQEFSAVVPCLAGKEYLKFKLLSVDAGGLWVECQYYTDAFLKGVEQPAIPRTPILFLPYSSISFVLDMADYPALSAEGLGLQKWD